MARGNEIVVTANPRGVFDEGYIASGLTPKPGTIFQRDPTVALQAGRFTYKLYAPGADGENPVGAIWVLTNLTQALIGKTATDALAAGDRATFYAPVAGEELNCLVKNLSGTADDHAAGEKMMVDDSTGLLIATTGSPENEPFQLLETITDPVADTLAWVQYGH